jgi:hypothetical protein
MELPGVSTGAEEHLAFVEQLLGKYDFHPDQRSVLRAEIADVRDRVNDPNLYMAVIGEASSGKSTFINALIGAPLLETGNVFEVTAAATVLTYGEALRATIRFRSTNGAAHTGSGEGHLEFLSDAGTAEASQVYNFGKEDEPISLVNGKEAVGLALEELIRKVTTDPAIARQVISMQVSYPAHFLADKICIIDTPGLNAQIADLQPKQVTQRAVAHADGAIILTRANQAMSHSLISLIHNELALGGQIRRCAFLITKMDQIDDESEQPRIVNHVRSVVRREFIPSGELPPVFFGAPKAALDAATGAAASVAQSEQWQARFATLQAELIAYLKRQRATVIAEKTLRLLNDLFATLDGFLEAKWRQFEGDRSRLEAAVIPDLKQFTLQQKQQCATRVEAVVTTAEAKVQIAAGLYREKLLTEIEADIMGQSSVEELKTYVEKTLPNLPAQRMSGLVETMKRQSAAIERAAHGASRGFEANFREAYQRLADARSSIRLRAARDGQTAIEAAKLASFGDGEAFQGPKAGTMMTGAAIGALIGSFIPGIGTLFGAALGFLASRFFGPSLDERKRTLWESIRPQLTAELEKVKAQAEANISAYGEATMKQLLGKIDEYARNYQGEVRALRAEQAKEAAALRGLQQDLEQDKYAVMRRRELLQAQLERLSAITF